MSCHSCCSCELMFSAHVSSCHASSCHVMPLMLLMLKFMQLMPKFMFAHAKIHVCSCQSSCLLMSCQFMRFFMPAHVMPLMPLMLLMQSQLMLLMPQVSLMPAHVMPIFIPPHATHARNGSAHARLMPSALSNSRLMPLMPLRLDRI